MRRNLFIFLLLLSFNVFGAKEESCQWLKGVKDRNQDKLFWLNNTPPKFDEKTQEQRNEWIEDYILTIYTIELVDKYYKLDNCSIK